MDFEEFMLILHRLTIVMNCKEIQFIILQAEVTKYSKIKTSWPSVAQQRKLKMGGIDEHPLAIC